MSLWIDVADQAGRTGGLSSTVGALTTASAQNSPVGGCSGFLMLPFPGEEVTLLMTVDRANTPLRVVYGGE